MKTIITILCSTLFCFNLVGQAGKKHFVLGMEKHDNGDFKGAIDAYTKCIELEPNLAEAYFNRGMAKNEAKDYYNAIGDFLTCINLKPAVAAMAYCNMGFSKLNVEDYKGAIADCSKSIALDANIASAYLNRALSKKALNVTFCADMKKAMELGDKNAINYYPLYCK